MGQTRCDYCYLVTTVISAPFPLYCKWQLLGTQLSILINIQQASANNELLLTWVGLQLFTKRRYARPHAGLAEDADSISSSASETPHGVQDALRQRLPVTLLTDDQRHTEHCSVWVVWRSTALHQTRNKPASNTDAPLTTDKRLTG